MQRKNFEFRIANTTLKGQYYVPDRAIAIVVLIHGLGEYSLRYERSVVPALLNSSFFVLSFDQFGHGHSGFKKGHHPGYEFLLDAIGRAIEMAVELRPGLPVFLYGHSMGGNLVLNYTLRRKHKLQGTVATSPFLRLAFQPPAWKLNLGKWIESIYAGFTTANDLDPEALSRDPNEVEMYGKDPLIHNRVSPAYSIEFLRTGSWALKKASTLTTPVLLIHGAADRITSAEATREFAREAGSMATYIEVPKGYHELHHDLDKQQVLKSICQWMETTINNNPK